LDSGLVSSAYGARRGWKVAMPSICSCSLLAALMACGGGGGVEGGGMCTK
jgi:hypothetical protein